MLLADVSPELLRTARENYYEALGHVPKPGQAALDAAVDAGKRHLGLFTPPQDGKSFHIAKHVGAYWAFPGTKMWIVAPTYEDGSKEFGYIWDDWAQLGILRTANTKHKDVRGGNMRIEIKNGTWVQVITAQDHENLRREQLDVVIYAEASKLDANLHKRYVYARVEKRRGKVFYPTTHKGYGWVYSDVRVPSLPVKDRTFSWGPWVDGKRGMVGGEANPDYDPDYWSCQVSYVPDFGEVLHPGEYTEEQIAKARKTLPPPMFAEQFGGEASSYAGLVYPFNPTLHECEPFQIPYHWTHVVGWDHGAGGGSDPTAIEIGSYGPDGVLYWWGEIYDQTAQSIQSRGSLLQVMLGPRKHTYLMTGRDSKQVITELRQVGLSASCPPDWSVGARIIRMSELLNLKKWKILKGRCPNLRREILQYEWDDKDPGKPKDGNDHALEAAGYAALAPVLVPEAGVGAVEETPEQRGERFRSERIWKPWFDAKKAEEQAASARRFERLYEPGVVEEYIAR